MASLSWTSADDLDLHMLLPGGSLIFEPTECDECCQVVRKSATGTRRRKVVSWMLTCDASSVVMVHKSWQRPYEWHGFVLNTVTILAAPC